MDGNLDGRQVAEEAANNLGESINATVSCAQFWTSLDKTKFAVFGIIADRRSLRDIVEKEGGGGFVNLSQFGQRWEKRVREVDERIKEISKLNKLVSSQTIISQRQKNLPSDKFVLMVTIKDMQEVKTDHRYSVMIDNRELISDLSLTIFEDITKSKTFFQ